MIGDKVFGTPQGMNEPLDLIIKDKIIYPCEGVGITAYLAEPYDKKLSLMPCILFPDNIKQFY